MTIKRRVLLWLCAAWVFGGILSGLFTIKGMARVQEPLGWLLSISALAGIYVWCRRDLPQRGLRRTSRWPLWCAFFVLPVLPLYLFRTRPAMQAFNRVVQGLGIYLGLAFLYGLAFAVVAWLGKV